MRKMVKDLIGNMKLVYIKCSLETCEKRDTKGMYKKAHLGEIKNFTGISAAFEEPEADIVVNSEKNRPEECTQKILQELKL